MKHDPKGVADRVAKLVLGYYGGNVSVERKQTTTNSEMVKLIFGPQTRGAYAGPGEAFNITITKARR